MTRDKLVELLDAMNTRCLETAETAQLYNGGPNDNERMYNYYDARAQGQYDMFVMLRDFIVQQDQLGAFEKA